MLVRTALVVAVTFALAFLRVVHGQDGTSAATRNASVRISATRHEPLPADVTQFWYVPGVQPRPDLASSTPLGRLARGIQLINSGDFSGGLALVNGLDLGKSSLAAFAPYYTGVAQFNLSRLADADAAFTAAK